MAKPETRKVRQESSAVRRAAEMKRVDAEVAGKEERGEVVRRDIGAGEVLLNKDESEAYDSAKNSDDQRAVVDRINARRREGEKSINARLRKNGGADTGGKQFKENLQSVDRSNPESSGSKLKAGLASVISGVKNQVNVAVDPKGHNAKKGKALKVTGAASGAMVKPSFDVGTKGPASLGSRVGTEGAVTTAPPVSPQAAAMPAPLASAKPPSARLAAGGESPLAKGSSAGKMGSAGADGPATLGSSSSVRRMADGGVLKDGKTSGQNLRLGIDAMARRAKG